MLRCEKWHKQRFTNHQTHFVYFRKCGACVTERCFSVGSSSLPLLLMWRETGSFWCSRTSSSWQKSSFFAGKCSFWEPPLTSSRLFLSASALSVFSFLLHPGVGEIFSVCLVPHFFHLGLLLQLQDLKTKLVFSPLSSAERCFDTFCRASVIILKCWWRSFSSCLITVSSVVKIKFLAGCWLFTSSSCWRSSCTVGGLTLWFVASALWSSFCSSSISRNILLFLCAVIWIMNCCAFFQLLRTYIALDVSLISFL